MGIEIILLLSAEDKNINQSEQHLVIDPESIDDDLGNISNIPPLDGLPFSEFIHDFFNLED